MPAYENLLTYKQCEEIHDLTVEFCSCWIKGWKLREQMVGAARSAKQCIAEGAMQGTSFKNYIKMVGISRGSLEELLKDFKDFARLRDIAVWDKTDPRLREMVKTVKKVKRETGKYRLPSTPSKPSEPSYPLNYLIDLTTRTGYLLDKQRESLEEKFIREGGYTENLFRRRIHQRNLSAKINSQYKRGFKTKS